MEAHANSASATTSEVWIVTSLGTTNEAEAFAKNNMNTKCGQGCASYGNGLSPAKSCNNSMQNNDCFNGPADPDGQMQKANCCCSCISSTDSTQKTPSQIYDSENLGSQG